VVYWVRKLAEVQGFYLSNTIIHRSLQVPVVFQTKENLVHGVILKERERPRAKAEFSVEKVGEQYKKERAGKAEQQSPSRSAVEEERASVRRVARDANLESRLICKLDTYLQARET